ncbi:gliding motility-associated C-terminal domain-containing protein, partial [Flavobacterium sp. LAR06]|uniref:T9SS type B sorting domain-containing protein n=1 Tax=Flavobacterium sp. LAR06 TaxID=3064897 RepID=UPI0035C00857
PTCSVATGSITFNNLPSGTWTLTQTGPVNDVIVGSGSSYIISGLIAGDYHFELNSAVFCTTNNGDVTINAQPLTPQNPTVNVIQPTCNDTGIVELSGLPSGDWTLNLSGTTISTIQGSGSTYSFTGLTVPGTYNLSVTNDQGCTSAGIGGIIIHAQPVTPGIPTVVGVVQPTCTALGKIQLSGLPSGNWILRSVGGTGPGISGIGPVAVIEDLPAGVYNITVTNDAGCVSNSTNAVEIFTQPPTPSAPIVGTVTDPTCQTATGSVELSGLPLGNWTINPGGISGTGTETTLGGLTGGNIYNFTVTNDTGCISAATGNVVINAQPVTPPAPIVAAVTAPTCVVATGSVLLRGLPNGNWIINPGAISGTGSEKQITGLLSGYTYNFTVTNNMGCTSIGTGAIEIKVQPRTPPIPIIEMVNHPTCVSATGSVILNGLPAGNWIINPGAVSGIGVTATIKGLVAGSSYNFTVTNDDGCTSLATPDIKMNIQPATPMTPIVEMVVDPTCAVATGSVTLSGLPSGNWVINPGDVRGAGSETTINGLLAGSNYNFSVTNDVGCTSLSTGNINIKNQPLTPSAPIVGTITNPTCELSVGSVILSGLPIGNWIINPGAVSGTGTQTIVTGLAAGHIYNFTVTNDLGCSSTATGDVKIKAQPITPLAPQVEKIIQPTCISASGQVTLSGLPTGNWEINPGGIQGSGSTTVIDLMAATTYNFTVTNDDGCTSLASEGVSIKAQPSTPAVPLINLVTQPTCSSNIWSVELSNLPAGNWIIRYGAIEVIGTGLTTTISNSIAGKYSFTVTNEDGCTSNATADIVIEEKVTPEVPIVLVIDNCNGTSTLSTTATGSLLWSTNETTSTITVDNAGIYTVISTNLNGCVSLPGSVMAAPKIAPEPPVVKIDKSTITIEGRANEVYSVDNGNFSDQLIYSNLEAGAHTIVAKNKSDCLSPITIVEIEEIPDKLIIYNAISPNGDGKNDYFNIQGLDYFLDNTVEIFDRYGISIFKARHYNNKTIVFRGEGLATGTYFYTIEYVGKDLMIHNLSGYLFVN